MGRPPFSKALATVHPLPTPIVPKQADRAETERFKFTAAKLEALQAHADGRVRRAYDEDQPKLLLVVLATGVKTFYVITKAAGRKEEFRLGRYDNGEMRIDAARTAARTILTRLASGEGARAVRQNSIAGDTTLDDAFEDLIENKRNKRGAFLTDITKRNYRHDFENHFDKLAGRALTAISDDDARALHDRIGRKHAYAANRVVALGSSIYGHANKRKLYVGTNPFAGIKKFPEDKRERFIRPDELPAFMDALATTPEPWRWLFSLALFTGVRRGNVIAARWKDFDIPAALWRMPKTKSGKSVTIPLSTEALAVLKQIPKIAGTEYLFPAREGGKYPHVTEPKKAWKTLLDRAGLTDLRIHDLRRTLGSWQAMTGASLPVIGKSLGHASHQSTEVYARLANAPVVESVAAATGAMLKAAKKGNRGASIRKVLGKGRAGRR